MIGHVCPSMIVSPNQLPTYYIMTPDLWIFSMFYETCYSEDDLILQITEKFLAQGRGER